jgi:hypothetical protein
LYVRAPGGGSARSASTASLPAVSSRLSEPKART